jgi:hypothetical protein
MLLARLILIIVIESTLLNFHTFTDDSCCAELSSTSKQLEQSSMFYVQDHKRRA